MATANTIPNEWPSVTRKFQAGFVQGQVTVGFLPTGKPCLVLIQTEKQEPLVAQLFQTVAILITTLLQKGVPLQEILRLVETADQEKAASFYGSNAEMEEWHQIYRQLFQVIAAVKLPPL